MKKILSIFAAMLCAIAMNAAVVLPATLDVTNVSFRSEGMPDFVLEEGDYAGTYFDMGAHDSSNDTLLYAEWDVTIESIKYNLAVDVYNTNSWRVQIYVLNQAGDTVKALRYKGSSGQCGQYSIGSIDMSDLEAGDYKVRARAATAWSAMKLKDVIFAADYQGVPVALPGTLQPAYALLSDGASIANNAIAFNPGTAPDEYAIWNVNFAEAGKFNVTIDMTAPNGHTYGVALLSADGASEIGAVAEEQAWDTGVKELGAIEVPAAGDYKVKLTNATQWSEAVINSIIFAAPAPELPYVALIGEMNGWDGSAPNQLVPAEDGLTASATFDLAMNNNKGYAFKILVGSIGLSAHHEGSDWYGLGRNNASVELDWEDENSDPIWLSMDIAGEYTFTYTYASKMLVVTFPALPPAEYYTVAGSSADLFGTTWDPTNSANDMTLVEGLYTWEKTELELAAGTIQFKVCENHAWTTAYPAQDYQLNIPEAGIYTITITFNADTKEVKAVATKTGDADVLPTVAMHGDFINKTWQDTENFTPAEDKLTASLTLNLAADNYEFGMRIGGSGNWTANGAQFTRESNSAVVVAGSGNLKLIADVDGEYVFTWTFATNTLTIAFPAGSSLDNTNAESKIEKFFRDGQLIIRKNGVEYNAQGAIVK